MSKDREIQIPPEWLPFFQWWYESFPLENRAIDLQRPPRLLFAEERTLIDSSLIEWLETWKIPHIPDNLEESVYYRMSVAHTLCIQGALSGRKIPVSDAEKRGVLRRLLFEAYDQYMDSFSL